MRTKARVACSHCVMDSSDPNIRFSDNGKCQYCENFEKVIRPSWQKKIENPSLLEEISSVIRSKRNSDGYDCIIGVSGGLDSSYAAFVAKRIMGLNPLLLHVDAGWNNAKAARNIACLVEGLEVDLHTVVIDWTEMKDLQVAFLKSQIPDQDLPQDAAFFSSLYAYAVKHNFKYIITGTNYSTECCREPEEWGGYLGIDKRLFFDIIDKFSSRRPRNFPLVDIFKYKISYRFLLGIKTFDPLNYVPFEKHSIEAMLSDELGWQPFKHKHHESIFTRYYESFWLLEKFGFDKRKAHFSSLIMTNQMSRKEAKQRLCSNEMEQLDIELDTEYVAAKLDMSKTELLNIFKEENKTYKAYKNKKVLIDWGAVLLRKLGLEKRLL